VPALPLDAGHAVPAWQGLERGRLIGPYDEGLIEDLKTRIPAKLRSWSPGLRAWRVHESALEDVAAIIERHGTTGGPGPEPDVDTIRSLLSGLGDEASDD
jgi:hypothetical protein